MFRVEVAAVGAAPTDEWKLDLDCDDGRGCEDSDCEDETCCTPAPGTEELGGFGKRPPPPPGANAEDGPARKRGRTEEKATAEAAEADSDDDDRPRLHDDEDDEDGQGEDEDEDLVSVGFDGEAFADMQAALGAVADDDAGRPALEDDALVHWMLELPYHEDGCWDVRGMLLSAVLGDDSDDDDDESGDDVEVEVDGGDGGSESE